MTQNASEHMGVTTERLREFITPGSQTRGPTMQECIDMARELLATRTNTPAPEWKGMESAPKDGTPFVAGRFWQDGAFDSRTYRWQGPPNYWNADKGGVCIRPEYQGDYLWCALPVAPIKEPAK